jgi:hypothetical protein
MRALTLVFALAFHAGCGFSLGEPTPGIEGRLAFRYTGELCLCVLPLDQPVATGGIVSIGITQTTPKPLQARTRSDVASVIGQRAVSGQAYQLEVDLHAERAGRFELEMVDDQGVVEDRVEILVEDPVRLELLVSRSQGIEEHPRLPIEVPVGADSTSIVPRLFGRSGKLAVHDNVEWTVEDELKVSRMAAVVPTALTVTGALPGTTAAVLRLGAFEQAVAIEVTRP